MIPPVHCNHEVGRAGADLANPEHNLRLAMISGFKTGFEIVKADSDPPQVRSVCSNSALFRTVAMGDNKLYRAWISLEEFRFLIDHGGS